MVLRDQITQIFDSLADLKPLSGPSAIALEPVIAIDLKSLPVIISEDQATRLQRDVEAERASLTGREVPADLQYHQAYAVEHPMASRLIVFGVALALTVGALFILWGPAALIAALTVAAPKVGAVVATKASMSVSVTASVLGVKGSVVAFGTHAIGYVVGYYAAMQAVLTTHGVAYLLWTSLVSFWHGAIGGIVHSVVSVPHLLSWTFIAHGPFVILAAFTFTQKGVAKALGLSSAMEDKTSQNKKLKTINRYSLSLSVGSLFLC